MSTTTPARRTSLSSLALTVLLAGALLVGTGVAPPGQTEARSRATTVAPTHIVPASYTISAATGLTAVRIAAAQRGKPYRWGGAGPWYYDCSGLVYYIYRTRLHHSIPRTANNQRLWAVRISKSQIRPGDLVFFMSYGRAYHVGIYAGRGLIWHAPRPGQYVKLVRIWTTAWVAGRVR
ncbi:C40 family peptidase [Intrasporangium flavum]|uniref:C40 family peptidase n=1 Tax=Intrasporangium flavum TaxID=1428657 RepID=UPI0009F9416A|nr:C40 family peptidase [Intrasporangium flavum]